MKNGFGIKTHIPHRLRVGSVIVGNARELLKVLYVKDDKTLFVRRLTWLEAFWWRLRRRWKRLRVCLAWLFEGVD